MNSCGGRRKHGFTLIEVLAVVSAVGVISAIAFSSFGNIRDNAKHAKLNTDVATVNSAVKQFLTSGGSLDKLTKPQDIIDALKADTAEDVRSTVTGFSGSSIDPRLKVVTGKAGNDQPVVTWSASDSTFVINPNGGSGILEFVLDENLADVDYGKRISTATVSYNKDPGWIWAYQDSPATVPIGPSEIPVTNVPNAEIPPPMTKLSPPQISIGSGTFTEDQMPLTVYLSNPNDPSTWIMFSINDGPFSEYSGPITVTEATSVTAYAEGVSNLWITSDDVHASYQVSPPPPPENLSPPEIFLTATTFTDTISEITLSITNPNVAGSSDLYYSIVAPAVAHPQRTNWTRYSGPLLTSIVDFPDGYEIATYARSTDTARFIDSATSTAATTVEFLGISVTGDVLFVVDGSGSMRTDFGSSTRFEFTINKLIEVIELLPTSIRYNVAFFADGVHWTDGSNELKKATNPNKNATINSVGNIVADGRGTFYSAALSLPEQFTPLPKQVIMLSDGLPTDTGFLSKAEELAALGIRVDAVGLALSSTDAGEGTSTEYSTNPLSEIARLTGGSYILLDKP